MLKFWPKFATYLPKRRKTDLNQCYISHLHTQTQMIKEKLVTLIYVYNCKL